MRLLLSFSTLIDAMNEKIGLICNWLVLLACIVSAGNAMVRYAYDQSSNAWLEAQWYMFAVIVMLGASYTLKKNEHVRVDLVYGNLSERARIWVDRGTPSSGRSAEAGGLDASGMVTALSVVMVCPLGVRAFRAMVAVYVEVGTA